MRRITPVLSFTSLIRRLAFGEMTMAQVSSPNTIFFFGGKTVDYYTGPAEAHHKLRDGCTDFDRYYAELQPLFARAIAEGRFELQRNQSWEGLVELMRRQGVHIEENGELDRAIDSRRGLADFLARIARQQGFIVEDPLNMLMY